VEGRRFLLCEVSLCRGCGLCVLVCSREKEGIYKPRAARVRLIERQDSWIKGAVACGICEEEACVAACPTGALEVVDGILAVDGEVCTGCGICEEACPYGSISVDPQTNVAHACDLCGGDPECVKVCPWEALSMSEGLRTADQRRLFEFRRLATVCARDLERDGVGAT